ncbi:MAG: HAD family hydrolase [Prevotellaceae bacterium]|jgi:phosphoglycolate phosphatase|nr:HAD family hydrolase [Prevotellaceae bacterium]
MPHTKLVIFDLDGTLLNTISDLARSTNYALKKNGFLPHPIEDYKYFVGNGIGKLFERALPEGKKTEENIMKLRDTFLPYYDSHNTEYTEPYEGIPELLNTLQSNGLKMAVASNKYQQATEKLINRYFPEISFTSVFGQRKDIPVKPNPAVVHEILRIADIPASEALYAGDSGVDMKTASNSGITSVGVTWGFRPRSELEANGAVHIADSPADILNLI